MILSTVLLAQARSQTVQVDPNVLGFIVPDFGTVLTFLIKGFFVIAGVMALFYLLLGALGWITSGGSKEAVDKARQKIQAAVVGIILVVVVLSVIVTLEQVIFQRSICFGISCPITIPPLLQPMGVSLITPTPGLLTPTPIPNVPSDPNYHPYNTSETNVQVGSPVVSASPTPTVPPTVQTTGGALDFILNNQPTPTP